MRPVLVGESPPARASVESICPLFPVPTNSAGGRLQRMTGLDRAEYIRKFTRINLVPVPGPPSVAHARWAAANLLRGGMLSGCSVVLLGSRVWRAFDFNPDSSFATWWPLHAGGGIVSPPGRVARLPHPSGRCRWYNDVVNLERATEFLTALARGKDDE